MRSTRHRHLAPSEHRHVGNRSCAVHQQLGQEALQHLAQAPPRLAFPFGVTGPRRLTCSDGSHRRSPAGGRACAAGRLPPALAGGAPLAVLLHAASVRVRRGPVIERAPEVVS